MAIRYVKANDVKGKRVLLRLDLNVPLDDFGNVLDAYRIIKGAETIKFLLEKGAKQIIILSHLGRPEGFDPNLSLARVRVVLESILQEKVYFTSNIMEIPYDERIVMLENIRFFEGEEVNDEEFAQKLARFADIYVNDAFSVCHRKHASVHAITKFLPSYAGPLIKEEIINLKKVVKDPKKPFIVILGGAKLKTKLPVINALLNKADYILLGGAMIFTFFAAQGFEVGPNKVEEDLIPTARKLIKTNKIILPVDIVYASSLSEKAKIAVLPPSKAPRNGLGLDLGPKTVEAFKEMLKKGKTIFWNGPLGYYEDNRFAKASYEIAMFLSKQKQSFRVVGGGDTLAILRTLNLMDKFDHVSIGGGASLKFISGEKLPGLEVLGYYEK